LARGLHHVMNARSSRMAYKRVDSPTIPPWTLDAATGFGEDRWSWAPRRHIASRSRLRIRRRAR
jgi:hypothetical protein